MAPFFDVILMGDGEELLPRFIDNLNATKNKTRLERLHSLTAIPGIYVPKFYEPEYDKSGTLLRISPIDPKIPEKVVKQTFLGNVLSHSTVITPDAAWPNIHMVEVVRSCPEMCRFCMASYLTLPFRTSSLNQGLIPAVEKGLKITNRIGLLGASVTQHPQFNELMEWLNQDKFDETRISVSSVRAGTITPDLSKILAKRGTKSITMAIESGSQKIRNIVNKKLNEDEIFNAAKNTYLGGLKGLKLYGMVGLPLENEEDIEKTADLLIRLKKQTSQLRFTLGVSTFVPKAHTPFQWYGIHKNADKRLKRLSKVLRPQGIEVRPESYKWSLIQALLSRGDRRLAPVIYAIRGSHNRLGEWKKAFNAAFNQELNKHFYPVNEPPPPPAWDEIIHDQWDTSKVLPWNHLEGPINKAKLIEHHLLLKT